MASKSTTAAKYVYAPLVRCPLGHGKGHLQATQIFIAVQLITILTHLSSGWTVPLRNVHVVQ